MSEPIYSITTERMYRRLPEVYRILDAQNEWQFKSYISSIADQLHEIDEIAARLYYVGPEDWSWFVETCNPYNTYVRPAQYEDVARGFDPIYQTSDLLDGRTSNAEWLPYIGQLLGASFKYVQTEADRRDAVINNFLGYRAGSRAAVEAAVTGLLTDTKYVRIYPHRDGAGGSVTNEGTQWDVLIITKPLETPVSSSEIVAEMLRKGAKPAGVVVHHIAYSLVWSDLETSRPTWADVEAAGSWSVLEAGNAELLPV